MSGGSRRSGEDHASTLSLAHTDGGPDVDDAPLLAGQTIGRYEVRRLLGRGGMGVVYLARDVLLGRSIALKVIATRGAARFLDEARTIAMLNHPHIVQLYDSGDHDGALYLALEYIDGETLRDRLERGGLGRDDALRDLRAVAEALAHAHAAGVIHCDLKPNNIMFGRDGRLRVVDFGIARTRDDTRSLGGTPEWMAPEQRAAGSVLPATDIWALGKLASLLLHDDAPAEVVELIRRSLDSDPARRPDAAAWVRVIDGLQRGVRSALADDGPFPGLAAFDEQHASVFVGREAAIDELVERLRETALLPIVGPSGTGKSSFLFAGVIPRLRASERWLVIALRPGDDPIGTLARHLTAAAGIRDDARTHAQQLAGELRATPTLLGARCATLARAEGGRVLIAIDQFEEVFTHGSPAGDHARFLEMLRAATDDAHDPIRVVLTVRDDFVGRLAGVRALFVLDKLTLDGLRRVVTEPIARVGYEIDAGLVDDVVAELATAGAADLPMLQFACRTLWEGRDRPQRRILRATYDAMGGLVGALARHAERALAELTAGERRIARGVLLQLVAGTTRRSVARGELTHGAADAERVVDRLVAARLLVQRTDDDERCMIEIAHEALLARWAQLARWIDESRDERRVLDELEAATALWSRRGQRDDETWSAIDIANARQRLARLDVTLPAPLEAFLAAGERRHRAQRRRRRIAYGLAVAAAVAVAIPATLLTSRYLAREHLIANNAGTIELVLRPFDWNDDDTLVAASLAELPALRWRLHAAAPGDPHRPGPALAGVETLAERRDAHELVSRIRATGGLAYLAIDGRGRAGEHCGPSWVRVQAFPGYVAGEAERIVVEVPTCRASADDTLAVPAGPFIYGGPGEPASPHWGEPDHTRPERVVDLPAFTLDRTEVSNARFTPFARLASITGYPPPVYGSEGVHAHDADAQSPVTAINLLQAAAYCRYLGKDLPTDEEWVKAARGGLALAGAPNPSPRRMYPWGTQRAPGCVNQDGSGDRDPWIAPVDSYPCGAGPYGHRHLVGNVNEWIASSDPLGVLRGGAVNSPPELDHTTTLFINHRNRIAFDYAIGVRCVARTERIDDELHGTTE